jgi:alkylation response protein AidB-like acyl-CoA dehydrogenase
MARVLGPELEAAIERAGRIAREILAPNAERIDRENVFLRDAGLLGLIVPRDYGGLGGRRAGLLSGGVRVGPSLP